ncbi:MAG: AAA family ATPase [Alphaproteobacteria bacterium]|nr:AAA family ATPase [Alphaproteobacteria bacterium]
MSGSDDISPLGQLDGGRKVLAFVGDADSVEALRVGLQALGGGIDLRRGTIRQAIRYLEKETPPRAIVVDVSDAENAQSALDDLARVCPPDVQVFVVGDNHDINFYRLLVDDVGVTEYLPKPLTRDSVQRQLLNRLSPNQTDAASPRGGQVISVFGARGGVGATTIACGLAMELSNIAKGHVALLDLHLQGGAMSVMLNGSPGGGLRMALEDAERADALFLERTAIAIGPRLQMIAADEPYDAEPQVTAAGVSRLVSLLQRKFNYVIIDMPVPLPMVMSPAVALSRHVVIVMGPDVVSLRSGKALRNWATGLTGTNRTISVINRGDSKGSINAQLVEKALGGKPDIIIPNAGRKMIEAVNLGIPAVQHVPVLKRHLQPLVREVSGLAPARDGSFLRRFFRG